jgi:subtilase family serine protease
MLQRIPRSTHLNLAIGLPLRNQDGLDLLLQQLSDPASPNYHQYLTPEQFTEQFGPTEEDYKALIDFAESNGLVVTATHPNRTILDVSGAAADIENAFHVNMLSYWHPVRGAFYAPDREPSLDFDIQTLDISGLDNFELPRPMALETIPLTQTTPFVSGSGPAGLFIGKDFRAAYAPGVTLTGAAQTLGLLEFDGFYASDVQANFKQAGLTAVPTQTVLLDGVSGAPGKGNIEVTLDIMMAAYMAPGLSKVMVYEGSNPNDILNRMATDNLAQQLSSSWGFSPINATTEQIFKQYIAQGQSFFQASGDSGAYKGSIMPPSDDPNVTVVGGTSLTTAGSAGPWQSESTWSGSGGGISASYPIPSYQQGLNMAANGGSATMRNIPDVALTAAVQMFLIQSNGQAVAVGGTSAAAPLWAGFLALANQQSGANKKPRVGFLNPLIYAIGKGLNHSTDLHDITVGNNSGFSAVSGYDLATGWGTPAGQHLIDDLTATLGQPAFTLSASQTTLSIKQGSSGTSTITVGPQNGFNGSVSLTVSALPAGVTASFSPASTTTASILTLTVSASAAKGTSIVTVTGASGR